MGPIVRLSFAGDDGEADRGRGDREDGEVAPSSQSSTSRFLFLSCVGGAIGPTEGMAAVMNYS